MEEGSGRKIIRRDQTRVRMQSEANV